MALKRETYAQAKIRLLAELKAAGWEIKPSLKVPQACFGEIQLFFKAQAVYLHAHSLWIDIRNMSVNDFISNVNKGR